MLCTRRLGSLSQRPWPRLWLGWRSRAWWSCSSGLVLHSGLLWPWGLLSETLTYLTYPFEAFHQYRSKKGYQYIWLINVMSSIPLSICHLPLCLVQSLGKIVTPGPRLAFQALCWNCWKSQGESTRSWWNEFLTVAVCCLCSRLAQWGGRCRCERSIGTVCSVPRVFSCKLMKS